MIENLQEISELKARYGYSVAKGIGEATRHTCLIWAQQDLGLDYVVHLVSGNVRLRKRMVGNKNDECIAKWEADLDWLRRRYYDLRQHYFSWPEY